jgi:hypothetical protein
MMKNMVLALTLSFMACNVDNLHAVERATTKTADQAYACAAPATYTVAPELVAFALTVISGVLGACTFTEKPDIAVGCFFAGLTAFSSAFITGAKHDFIDHWKKDERRYYDRMTKVFLTLMAPSVLASGFACPDEASAPVLKGFGLLGSIATALAWL